jgi:hypothetical protein
LTFHSLKTKGSDKRVLFAEGAEAITGTKGKCGAKLASLAKAAVTFPKRCPFVITSTPYTCALFPAGFLFRGRFCKNFDIFLCHKLWVEVRLGYRIVHRIIRTVLIFFFYFLYNIGTSFPTAMLVHMLWNQDIGFVPVVVLLLLTKEVLFLLLLLRPRSGNLNRQSHFNRQADLIHFGVGVGNEIYLLPMLSGDTPTSTDTCFSAFVYESFVEHRDEYG